MIRDLILGSLVFSSCFFYKGTSAQVTPKDYTRADSVMQLSELVYNEVKDINWIDSTSTCFYKVKTRNGIEYMLVDAEKKTKTSAFDSGKLVEALNQILDKKTSVEKLNLQNLKFDISTGEIRFVFNKAHWTCRLSDYKLTKDSLVKAPKPNKYWNSFFDEQGNDPVMSPDSVWTAFIKNHNVYIKSNKDDKEYQLSFDGSPGDFYSSYVSWSPNSKKLAVNKVRDFYKRQISFVESSPKNQLQPILHNRDYLKPGDVLPIKRPCLFDVESKTQFTLDTKAFEHQFNLSNPTWNKAGSAFSFEFNERGHQRYQVVEVDATTADVRVVIDETSQTFIDYSSKRYRYDLDESNEIIWASERDGWNHLYLIDRKTGKVKNQITKGEWVVRNVLYVDENERTIYFYGSGKNSNEDPYYLHCYKVNFDGKKLMDLTPEKMNHTVLFSKDKNYFTDTYSTVEAAPVSVVRRTRDGKVLLELERTDITDMLAKGWIAPEPFVAKARDGKTDIWGNIYRPTNFDPNKSYPIIEYIYAGPHGSFTQKSFRAVDYKFSGLAELGFIIVQLDGLGTSNRSKAFQDVCWKNLKDAGFPDRILWMKAAAENYPYMDTTRVGIFGGSAGGQSSTGAVLFHPEFYDVAVSSCGCHDNRVDKIWWNEQWMGYPIGPHYAECSNVVNANKLQGNLMLIVGEMDDNVDPASTVQVVDALIKADKDFEFVLLPGMNHTLGGKYGETKRRDFFIKHLKGEKMLDWNKK